MSTSVYIGYISFDSGFSDGFQTTNTIFLTGNYFLESPTISAQYNPDLQVVISADTLSASYRLEIPSVIISIPEWINCPQSPWNSYWRDDTECKDNERYLYDSVLTDTYNKFAVTWIYYPTTYNITYDRVFKEDQNRFVIRAFSALGYIEDIPPEHKTYNIEGIVGIDIVRAYFSISHFTEAATFSGVTSGAYESYTPTVGDICYLTSNGVFYEVISVKTTVEQFLNRSHNYEVVMKIYRDNKMTVSADSPTLIDNVILTVCTSALSATTQFEDYLAINTDVDEMVSSIEYIPKPGEETGDAFGGW